MTDIKDLTVDTKILDPAGVWKDKDEFVARERQSYLEWEKMNEAERAAALRIIERALDRLRDTTDVWVPASIAVKSGSCLDVKFRLMFSDIEEEINAHELITSRTIKEAAENTQKLISELEGNP